MMIIGTRILGVEMVRMVWLNVLIELFILFVSGAKREEISYYFLYNAYCIPPV